MPGEQTEVTAAILVIGDEILSGRTKDRNIGIIAEHLTSIGIRLAEVRIVGDLRDEIINALNDLRRRYRYVFTTGGIGPTHDDITAESVAGAFGVGIHIDPRARKLLEDFYLGRGLEVTAARLRMARVPDGAALIENALSVAPGFLIGNVIVMAGVPDIMRSMLDAVSPRLETGARVLSETVRVLRPESEIADAFARLQDTYPDVAMGSYPLLVEGRPAADLVLRSSDVNRLAQAVSELRQQLEIGA